MGNNLRNSSINSGASKAEADAVGSSTNFVVSISFKSSADDISTTRTNAKTEVKRNMPINKLFVNDIATVIIFGNTY